MFQINNTKDGYIVEVFNTTTSHWDPIANFGDHQGDAILFKNYDAPRLTEDQLRNLVEVYDKQEIFQRLAAGHYQKNPFAIRKGHYYITGIRNRSFEDAGTNKRKAIKMARERALMEKQSIELWHGSPVKDVPGAVGRFYVGIMEFPYHLRNCQLTTRNITVNI